MPRTSAAPVRRRVAAVDVPAERVDDVGRTPFGNELALLQEEGPRADLSDDVDRVRHEHDRSPIALEVADPAEAATLERLVADGEDLVHDEDLRVDVNRNGESEPDVHPGRVVPHLHVDERLELGEGDDVVEVAGRSPCASGRGSTR